MVRGCPQHMCTCIHAHAYDIIGNSQGFPQWGLPFAIEIIMFNVYMCTRACACMCVGGRITITFEQNEIIEFCLKIWDS